MENSESIFKSKVFQFVALVAIIAAIPITVLLSQQTQETRQRAIEPIISNSIYIKSEAPKNGSTVNNPVNFSGIVNDEMPNLIGQRYITIYVDGKKLPESGFVYERKKESATILGTYGATTNSYYFNSGTHTWFARLSSPDGLMYVDTLPLSFKIGGIAPSSYPSPTNTGPIPTGQYITPSPTGYYPTPTYIPISSIPTPTPVITGGAPSITPVPGKITIYGYVYYDINKNGIFDQGEQKVDGSSMYLYGPSYYKQVVTANGYYLLSGLTPGDYTLYYYPPKGYSITFPNVMTQALNYTTIPSGVKKMDIALVR